MTQSERLKALLAEARDCINTEWAGNRKTIARIDAALARPGEVHPSNLTDVVTLLENDRDEARAEIERLRQTLSVTCEREPTKREGDALERKHNGGEGRIYPASECFVANGGWTGRRCRRCTRWVWGGPTACERCVAEEERDEARAEVATAYRRGAEVMREIAADLFQGNKPGLAAMPAWAAFIRSLPIPEDKR